jgi:hypothetical protein
MTQGRVSWFCEVCKYSFPAQPGAAPIVSESAWLSISEAAFNHLPGPIAIVFHAAAGESHPVMRLHRVCDAVEVLTRFLAIVALAEVRSSEGSAHLPKSLLASLQPDIERPTFGRWRDILRECVKFMPGSNDALLPGLVPSLIESEFLANNFYASRSSGLAVSQTSFYDLANINLVHQIIPGGILWELID